MRFSTCAQANRDGRRDFGAAFEQSYVFHPARGKRQTSR
jgi:hypothetical protein